MSPNQQADLFNTAPAVQDARAYVPSAETVRPKLARILETMRAADAMPWAPADREFHRTVFPQMARWLPAPEAERLKAEFDREWRRLSDA